MTYEHHQEDFKSDVLSLALWTYPSIFLVKSTFGIFLKVHNDDGPRAILRPDLGRCKFQGWANA